MRVRLFGLFLWIVVTSAVSAQELPRAPEEIPLEAMPKESSPGLPLLPHDDGEPEVWSQDREFLKPPAYPPSSVWISASYLHWWMEDDALPPLITFGDAGDPLPAAFGQPGTRLLIGNHHLDAANGVRATIGYAKDVATGRFRDHGLHSSLEASVMYLHRSTSTIAAPPGNTQVLGRSFFNLTTGREEAFIVFSPGLVEGGAFATSDTTLYGAEGHVRWRWEHQPHTFLSILGGVRYLHLDDNVRIEEFSRALTTTLIATRAREIYRFDDYSSQNTFFGPQIGLEWEYYRQYLIINVYGKAAIGVSRGQVDVTGVTITRDAAGVLQSPAEVGLFIQDAQRGSFDHDALGALVEIGLTFGIQCTEHCRISVGYSWLFWDEVARAGGQIRRNVNLTDAAINGLVVGGGATPAGGFSLFEDEFWIQGFSFTAEWRY